MPSSTRKSSSKSLPNSEPKPSSKSSSQPKSNSKSKLGTKLAHSPDPSQSQPVSLRIVDREFPVKHEQLEKIAPRLQRMLERRKNWIKVETLRESVSQKTGDALRQLLGLAESDQASMEQLSRAGMIEVSIDATSEAAAVAQQFPWEFLLASATEAYRSESAIVIRHLRVPGKSAGKPAAAKKAKNFLLVRSMPDVLNDYYDDESLRLEQANIEASLALASTPEHNPTLAQLEKMVSKFQPQIIHLAGIDPTQAKRFLEPACSPLEIEPPGMMLKSEDGNYVPVQPQALAGALCAARTKPVLVSFNFLYSASLGAAAVEHGAEAALCFQGDMDDLIAEIFFCNFYLAWRLARHSYILDAFRLAWQKLAAKQRTQLQGTGIILWSAHSLLDQERLRREKLNLRSPISQSPKELENEFDRCIGQAFKATKNAKPLKVVVYPANALNYSLLHNDRSPFEMFVIRKEDLLGKVNDISIEVTLHGGQEAMTYKAVESMDYTFWLVHEDVRFALTSVLARSVRESMYTTMFVRVTHDRKCLYEKTHRIKLLPVDHWQDDNTNRQWLPSFVLSRDPCIGPIIDSAQKYLGLLGDDYSAGFDGYLSKPEDVDDRVRGIWWALSHDLSIGYIAPPPTFENSAQRLRSPSEILTGHRATCIDLALLLASCLEYVDLYPVIFLLEGHAFAGYYRSAEAYEKVRDWAIEDSTSPDEQWLFGTEFFERLVQLVQEGDLVPLETVCLTEKTGFWEAVEQGALNLRSKTSFQYMVDIKSARESNVTPLPL